MLHGLYKVRRSPGLRFFSLIWVVVAAGLGLCGCSLSLRGGRSRLGRVLTRRFLSPNDVRLWSRGMASGCDVGVTSESDVLSGVTNFSMSLFKIEKNIEMALVKSSYSACKMGVRYNLQLLIEVQISVLKRVGYSSWVVFRMINVLCLLIRRNSTENVADWLINELRCQYLISKFVVNKGTVWIYE